jgi:site-specific DNA-methyltransferase (adenine-specific)
MTKPNSKPAPVEPIITEAHLVDLKPDLHNANQHTERGTYMLNQSVGKFGSREAGTVDKNGFIVGGNNRHTAYGALGIDDIQIIKADPNKPVFLQYDDLDLTDPDNPARELSVALNRSAQVGISFDPEILAEYQLAEVDLSDWFKADELDEMFAGIGGEPPTDGDTEPQIDETEAEKYQAIWQVKPGDIWELGRHKIACADSTDEATVKALIGVDNIGIVWGDPPYGIKAASSYADGTVHKGMYSKRGNHKDFIGDDTTETARVASKMLLRIAPNSIHFWWGANHYCDSLPPSSCWIFWDKVNPGVDFSDGELCWSNQKLAIRIFKHQWMGIWKDSEKGKLRVHPTQKPVALAEWCFEKYGKPGDVVFDPFLGSGISVIAAEKMNDGRCVIGCELAPEYIATTIQRWVDLTGKTPVLTG